jgi:hypothetical protein
MRLNFNDEKLKGAATGKRRGLPANGRRTAENL